MEIGLTRKEQENARKKLKDLGFLTENKGGVPCKVYFKVERENLYKALIEYFESLNSSQYAPTRLPSEFVNLSFAQAIKKPPLGGIL